MFLVGAFSFEEKMPDSYSGPFFLQTTDLTLIGPLFTETTKTTKAKLGQRKLNAKGPPFRFFFSTVRLCENFSKSPKGPPPSFLKYFATECMLMNPKRSPFYIFRHYATFSERKNEVFLKCFFCSQLGKRGFRVLSSMKGTL